MRAIFSDSVELYDLIYSHLKDYAAETAEIAARLEAVDPKIHHLLDVGCGTGEHARLLSARGYAVDGIDIEPRFVDVARTKSDGSFFCADMRTFDLPTMYDAVLCLFSSIGYVKTVEGLDAAMERFRAHLRPGGIVLVEPWFGPEVMHDGKVHLHTAEADGVHVSRLSHTQIDGRISRLNFEYTIGRPTGIEHASEVHELGLFTGEEMEASFARAGLTVEHDPVGLTGRGLYLGRLAE